MRIKTVLRWAFMKMLERRRVVDIQDRWVMKRWMLRRLLRTFLSMCSMRSEIDRWLTDITPIVQVGD